MRLLLTSGGLTNRATIQALQDLVHKPFESLSVAFIPTAANVESSDKKWLIKDINRFIKLKFKLVDIVDISSLPQDLIKSRLERADILVFGGGNTFHLMYWLKKSGVDKSLPELLKTRIYVGISAGSIVASQTLHLSKSQRLYSTEITEYKGYTGLGIVDFYIQPHLNSSHFKTIRINKIKDEVKDLNGKVYAIDDNTALKVENKVVSVISKGKWKLI